MRDLAMGMVGNMEKGASPLFLTTLPESLQLLFFPNA